MNQRTIVLLMVLAGLSLPVAAQTAENSPALFEDPLHGYALRPPVGARRIAPESANVLARWVMTDGAGQETLFRLDVQKVRPQKTPIDIEAWKKTMIEDLALLEGTEVSAATIRTIAGRQGLELAGRLVGKEQLTMTGQKIASRAVVFRQLWVVLNPEELLLIKLDATEMPELDVPKIWARLIASITLTDPKVFLRQQEQGLEPARVLLAEARGPSGKEMLASAMPTQPQWFLLRDGKEVIGWQMMLADQNTRGGKPGWRVRQWSMIAEPSQPVVLIFNKAFLDESFESGAWRQRVQIGQGQTTRVMSVEGVRQEEVIVGGFGPPGDMTRRTAQRPEPIRPIYLPEAMAMILPRLVAPKIKPGANQRYTFGVYDVAADTFPMRIFSLEGVEAIQHNGQSVQAYKALDRREYYRAPVTVFFDGRGKVLLERNQQGQTVQAVDEAAVLRAFPTPPPAAVIRAMNAADSKATLVPRGSKAR